MVGVVQEKLKFGNLKNTTLGILADIFHYINAIIKLPAKKIKKGKNEIPLS